LNFKNIEKKWIEEWDKNKIFESDYLPEKPKYFITFPFPYMSGPLHIGTGFTAGRLDIISRYKKMQGYNVLFPWAWHWTGEAVMGISDRIKKQDQKLINTLLTIDNVPKSEIQKFQDPRHLVKYYTEHSRDVLRSIGLSLDWRREFHTTDLHPSFNRFVEWQIKKLGEKGYIRKGTHPVVWCPECESPTGDHDRLQGEGIRPEEYTLIKFKMNDTYLVAGTFRPETIFGITNIWINPDSKYVEALIDEEKWIISKDAVLNLKEQLHNIKIIRTFKGNELIEKNVYAPMVNKWVPILPASFVDSKIASGIVYSVPAHAPLDWLAFNSYKSNTKSINSIKPISIIKVEGFEDYPAIEISNKMNITDQFDKKTEKATEIIYAKEFHTGTLKSNCLEYSGLSVKEARDLVKKTLIDSNQASKMYGLSSEVICRSGTQCLVKIIQNQWFIRYSDQNWKKLCKKAIDKIDFYPPEVRESFLHYIDWLEDWACARKTGLGTPFPFDNDWIVETLTDSTIYMAFYIISKYVNNEKINVNNLNDTFFDYLFLNDGNIVKVSESTKISKEILTQIKNDFNYWYPVDLRGSGKDLVGNHLSFYIFHHVALFDPKHWPKSISVNGFMKLEGQRTSKSKGWFIPLWKSIEDYGADPTRLALIIGADGLDDPDWRKENAIAIQNRIQNLYNLISKARNSSKVQDITFFDNVILSQLQMKIDKISSLLDNHKIGAATRLVIYDLYNDFQEYMNNVDFPNTKIIDQYIHTWVKLLQPFAPFTSEEIWHSLLGKSSFICFEEWPSKDQNLIHLKSEYTYLYLNTILEDVKEVIKILPNTPSQIHLYIASEWKWHLIKKLIQDKKINKQTQLGDLIQNVMKNYPKIPSKTIVKTAKELMKPDHEIGQTLQFFESITNSKNEHQILNEFGINYLEKKLGLKIRVPIQIQQEDSTSYDPLNKSSRSLPFKPGIYVE